MKISTHWILSTLLLLAGATATAAPPAAEVGGLTPDSATLPSGARVTFDRPEDWKVEVRTGGPSVTLELGPEAGTAFVVLVTVLPLPPDQPMLPEEVRAMTQKRGEEELAGALQDSIELREVKGPGVTGYLYHLTDRNPESGPEDYREVNQGILSFGLHIATVTILSHPGDEETPRRAVELLESLEVGSGT